MTGNCVLYAGGTSKDGVPFQLYHGPASNGLNWLEAGWTESVIGLIWTDPPYGIGGSQSRGGMSYADPRDLTPVLAGIEEWSHIVQDRTVLAICCDYRLAPKAVQRATESGLVYRGEIVWESHLGRPRTSWWPVRHNNILTFTRTEACGLFDPSAIPKVPRQVKSPGYPDDRPAGSVWNYTFYQTHPERVRYPSQKPTAIITPFVLAHTLFDDTVIDPFCGSGSTGVAALLNGRRFIGSDISEEALDVAYSRLKEVEMPNDFTRLMEG